ncbi:MAG: gliding motility-associated C-terminal domain-containing protein [Bacteroidota bacterium]
MRKFLTLIFLVFIFLSISQKLKAQVITEIGNSQMCYNTPTSMPVVVQNMNGVDTLRLALAFNSSVIEFIEHFAVNSALSGGAFTVTNDNDSIIINWSRATPASLAKDTLVWLRFKGLSGSTAIHWLENGSRYHTAAGNTPIVFIDGHAGVSPQINVLLTQIDPTCSNLCDANFSASAMGGTAPLGYKWNGKPGRFDSIQTGLCSGAGNLITITDSWGCRLDSAFIVNGLPGANVKLIIEGNSDTAIYLENPVLTFSFQEVSPTHVVDPPLWEFGDGDTAVEFKPTHVYSRANTNTDKYYLLRLHIKNENGCDSLIELRIPIKTVKLKIPGVITPNGDGINESFTILNESKTGSGEEIKVTTEFEHMELLVFDRWGRKLYADSNYKNDWSAKGVPDGAYYFILKTVGFYQTDTYKGSLTILGSGMR